MDDFAGNGGGRYGRRVLLYSHDTFGLGHLRRSRTIAIAMTAADPDLSALITTGSPIAGRFDSTPDEDASITSFFASLTSTLATASLGDFETPFKRDFVGWADATCCQDGLAERKHASHSKY